MARKISGLSRNGPLARKVFGTFEKRAPGVYKKQLLKDGAYQSKAFLRGLLNMREKQILTSITEIQKENWG